MPEIFFEYIHKISPNNIVTPILANPTPIIALTWDLPSTR